MEQNQKKNWQTITCPHCGMQYLPGEIFMPGDLLGKSTTIIRDALGKILYVEYAEDEEPKLFEKYYCDQCDKPFIVEPVVTYKVSKEAEELDFSDPYVSLL